MSLLGMGISLGTSILSGVLGRSAAKEEQRKAEAKEKLASAGGTFLFSHIKFSHIKFIHITVFHSFLLLITIIIKFLSKVI